jgi:hypothetical protein
MSSVIKHELLETRADIPLWIAGTNYRTFAEIGVRSGEGLKLFAACNPKLVIGVDLWSDLGPKSQNDAPITQNRLDAVYQELLGRGRVYWPFLKLIRKHSVLAADDVEDGSLDFVFIDADHTYEAVAADIKAWWPKVRLGGTLAGHDYVNHTLKNGVSFGVIQAVDEFSRQIGLKEPLHTTAGKDYFASWFITKTPDLTPP